MINESQSNWELQSKQHVEANSLSCALQSKQWAFAASLIAIDVSAEFSKIIDETVNEMNAENTPEDEVDSKEWNCLQQMNG